jgi:DNA repair protein RecO (recombination protein O)
MLQKTKGLVMRSVKYGETSLVVTLFTELFGLQSYMVSGVRKTSSKGASTAGQYQPGALLDLVVYHHGQKNLQRIRESGWAYIYRNLYNDIHKNAVALFMVELLQKCLRQPEPQPDLFQFTEDALRHLDEADPLVAANYPVYFALHLSHFFGFRMQDSYSEEYSILDLREGEFIYHTPSYPEWAGPEMSRYISMFLKAIHPEALSEIHINRELRRKLLDLILVYYRLHSAEFGEMRSLPVLQAILE